MTPKPEEREKRLMKKILEYTAIALLLLAVPGGIALGIWLDEPTWCLVSVGALILVYAG